MKHSLFNAATAAVFATMVGTVGASADGHLTKINYGYLPVPTAPLFAAEAHGLFEKYGLDVDLIKFTSGPAQFQSLQAGSIDMGQGALAAFYMASSRGLAANWVYSFGDAAPIEGFVLAEGTQASSYKDIAGKSITAPSGSILHLFHVSQAMDAGIELSDIEFISLPPPQAVPAIENGNVDAAWFWEPLLSIAQSKGATQMMMASDVGLHDIFGLAASSTWLEDDANVEALSKLIQAFEEGMKMYEADPAPTLAKIEEFTGIKPELAARIVEGIEWADMMDQTKAGSTYNLLSGDTPGEGARETIEWVESRALAAELMDDPGDLAGFLDGRAAQMAVK